MGSNDNPGVAGYSQHGRAMHFAKALANEIQGK